MKTELERFHEKIENIPESGCWLWVGATTIRGYGRFRVGEKFILPHRWAYEFFKGPIPKGLELDHLCRVTGCCNPDHLEPVTHKENCTRGIAGEVNGRRQREKSHCPKGHPYSGENVRLTKNGWRRCRACGR